MVHLFSLQRGCPHVVLRPDLNSFGLRNIDDGERSVVTSTSADCGWTDFRKSDLEAIWMEVTLKCNMFVCLEGHTQGCVVGEAEAAYKLGETPLRSYSHWASTCLFFFFSPPSSHISLPPSCTSSLPFFFSFSYIVQDSLKLTLEPGMNLYF